VSHDQRVAVVHFTAPTCWWSWGFEPVFNRLKLVYGNQIDIFTGYGTVYEDAEEYKKGYELDEAGMLAWAKESKEIMGVPMHLNYSFNRMPKTLLPATLAVMAAERQGHDKGHRFFRELLRRNIVEAQDVTQEATIFDAARRSGLDDVKFKSDWADQAGLKVDLEKQGEGAPPVHVGFYNIAVTDGHGRTVYLDQIFQPSAVEGAIDYLSEGKLTKTKPTDVLAYLELHGPTSLVEVERVFDLSSSDAAAKLEELERLGRTKRSMLAGSPFWLI
jgi:predicted DsbA family dithiol-disulfide isomerase